MSILPETVAFYIVAVVVVISALAVVLMRNIVYSAVALAMSFLGVAALYLLLSAEFIAAVQVILYVGAVLVLILFAIMLTHDSQSSRSNPANLQAPWAGVVAVALLGVILAVLARSTWSQAQSTIGAVDLTPLLGELLFNDYVLPFEIASVLLLVAMIGAIVLARQR